MFFLAPAKPINPRPKSNAVAGIGTGVPALYSTKYPIASVRPRRISFQPPLLKWIASSPYK